MKRLITILSIIITLFAPAYAALMFENTPLIPVAVSPEASTGLEAVYVLNAANGVTAIYPSSHPELVQWQRFSRLGGAYAEPVTAQTLSNGSAVRLSAGDMGYIVTDGGVQHCFWIVDYSAHTFTAENLTPGDSDCSSLRLNFTGNGSDITYYTINGRPVVLSRDIELSYTRLEFDAGQFAYRPETSMTLLASINSGVSVPAPLCATSYRLEGDRFLRAWNRSIGIESPTVQPTAVAQMTNAVQNQRQNDNEQNSGDDGLGGSAPCEINFEAAVTDAALFHEWQISRTADFDIVELSYSDLSVDLTFRDQGTTYVRFTAANADGTCQSESDVYQIFIGESRLEIPNAFSPQGSPGVNDEWKVSYKSLVSYQCNIFNRAGQQIFSSNDPSQGWDGKYRGRYVPAGVYYYVIQAEGADGISYRRGGDINIIGFSEGSLSSPTDE